MCCGLGVIECGGEPLFLELAQLENKFWVIRTHMYVSFDLVKKKKKNAFIWFEVIVFGCAVEEVFCSHSCMNVGL